MARRKLPPLLLSCTVLLAVLVLAPSASGRPRPRGGGIGRGSRAQSLHRAGPDMVERLRDVARRPTHRGGIGRRSRAQALHHAAWWRQGGGGLARASATTRPKGGLPSIGSRRRMQGTGARCQQPLFNIGGSTILDTVTKRPFCSGTPFAVPQFRAQQLSTTQNINGTFWASDDIYRTAQAVSSPSVLSYSVNVTQFVTLNGAKSMWLRLHFAGFPAMPPFDNPRKSLFDASANGVLLLQNYSVTADAAMLASTSGLKTSGVLTAVMKEFLLPASPLLTLTLTPSPGSYAFINGIEVVPLPQQAEYAGSEALFASPSQPPTQGTIPPTQSFALKFRVQTSPYDSVSGARDQLARTWLNADRFQKDFFGSIAFESPVSLQNGDMPPYYVPQEVATFNREVGPGVTAQVNMSYSFPVTPGAQHWLRLFFAENEYSTVGDRVMDIYVNDDVIVRSFDILLQTQGAQNALTALDIVYNVPTTVPSLDLTIGSSFTSRFSNPALTAAELLRVGNTSLASTADSNFDGGGGNPSPLPPTAPLPTPTPSPNPAPNTEPSQGTSAASVSTGLLVLAILGGILAAAVLVGLLLVGYVWWSKHRRHAKADSGALGDAASEGDELWVHGNRRGQSTTTVSGSDSSRTTRRPGSTRERDSAMGKMAGLFGSGVAGPSVAHASVSSTSEATPDVPSTPLWKDFTLKELQKATGNWDDVNILGEGGFGTVYRAKMAGGSLLAVKRARECSEQGSSEFETEVVLLSKLRHRHLVSLLGVCTEGRELILVYEHMGNGTLRRHLYGSNLPSLSWKQRLEIAIGAARGLHYLHTGFSAPIIHRDVKSTNILLDSTYGAKLSDFGLSKLGPTSDERHVSTEVKGSFGYLDPEYFKRQQLTDKSDVYSFGVVLLELLCARPAIDTSLPRDEASLADWAVKMIREGRVEEIVDRRLMMHFGEESMERFVETAVKCLADYGEDRPAMGTVLFELEATLMAAGSVSSLATNKDDVVASSSDDFKG